MKTGKNTENHREFI